MLQELYDAYVREVEASLEIRHNARDRYEEVGPQWRKYIATRQDLMDAMEAGREYPLTHGGDESDIAKITKEVHIVTGYEVLKISRKRAPYREDKLVFGESDLSNEKITRRKKWFTFTP